MAEADTEMPRSRSTFIPVRAGASCVAARFHGARELDRTAHEQELLGERGLARVGVRNDGEGAPAADLPFELGIGHDGGRLQIQVPRKV
jgi:hypothetical protein